MKHVERVGLGARYSARSGDEGKSDTGMQICCPDTMLSSILSYRQRTVWQNFQNLVLVTLSHFQCYAQGSVGIQKLHIFREP